MDSPFDVDDDDDDDGNDEKGAPIETDSPPSQRQKFLLKRGNTISY